MPIILLEPPRPKNPDRFEDVVNAPLSACLFTGYIASVLRRNKIAAEIVNAHLHDWSIAQTIARLSSKSFMLLCVHTVYLWERTQEVFDMISALKAVNSTAHINLYGYYPTFAYKKILADFPFVDSVSVGEPEFTTLDLAKRVLSPNTPLAPFDKKEGHGALPADVNIAGLAFRDKRGDIAFNPRPPIQDLDQLPYPDRQDIGLYREQGIVTYIQGSRGCYGRCTFCYLNPFYGQTEQWRGRSAKNIFEEMNKLSTEYSITDFYFSDANFFGPGKSGKERAITLAELILANNLDVRFGFECRANDVEEYSLSKLVMAGLSNVFLGLESGDPASLKRFRKHTTVDENKRAIQLLRDYGIEPTFGFIMFEPNSTLESVRNNFTFLQEIDIMATPAVTAHLLHHRQTLFEGTPDYQAMARDESQCGNSFTDYEALYQIKDPKADAFAEVISGVCRAALALAPQTFECGTGAPKDGASHTVSDVLNNTLIALFEETLAGFEANAIPADPHGRREVARELIHRVETAIRSR